MCWDENSNGRSNARLWMPKVGETLFHGVQCVPAANRSSDMETELYSVLPYNVLL